MGEPGPASPRGTLRSLLPLLLLLAMVGPLTLNILNPSLPGMARVFGVPKEMVQLTLSLYIVGMGLAQLIAGPLADRFGRKPVIVAALTLYIVSSLIAARAESIGFLITSRFIQAIGATASLALTRTIIGDLSDRATTARMIAYVTMVMVLAPMASPNIGGFLDRHYGWPSIFVFCALFGVVVIALSVMQLFESRPATLTGATFSDVRRRTLALLRNRLYMRYVLLAATASAVFFTFIGGAPYLVIEGWGYPPEQFGYWFTALGIGYALGNFTAARATSAFGLDRIIAYGNLVALAGIALIAVLALVPVRHPAAVFLPAILFTYGNGLVMPNAFANAIQTDRNAGGAASGLMGFTQMSLGAIGSFVVAKLPATTALSMASVMGFFGVVSFLLQPARVLGRRKSS